VFFIIFMRVDYLFSWEFVSHEFSILWWWKLSVSRAGCPGLWEFALNKW
jgi:hypothetical protein